MYGYQCEYCDGIVQKQILTRDVFEHRDGMVILENAPIGVCNKCGERYYRASLLHLVEDIRTHKKSPTRYEQVPVAVCS